jgi:hypothetical protein
MEKQMVQCFEKEAKITSSKHIISALDEREGKNHESIPELCCDDDEN